MSVEKAKVTAVIDRHEHDLRLEVNGCLVGFIWDVTGIENMAIKKRGKTIGVLKADEIRERW